MDLYKNRILRIIWVLQIAFATSTAVFSQEHHNITKNDSNTLRSKLMKFGAFHAHARSFFMATDNAKPLTDYVAWGLGAGIGYESPKWKGFQIGISGFFIFNVVSSDLGKKDTLANSANRYESGLFDLSDPANRFELHRLENLFLRYSFRKSKVEVGRFEIITPFINPQDGRMRSTMVEGAWFDIKEVKKLSIEGGWIWRISPRSTVKWYTIGKSMGVYPMGINEYGKKSNYSGNVKSAGIGILGLTYSPIKQLKLQAWEQFTENVFNTVLIQADAKIPMSKAAEFSAGLMYVRQDAVNCGGNCDSSKTFFTKGGSSNVISSKIGVLWNKLDASVNYTHITTHGRFLMPREWGREPFYTFLPRERNEGAGNLHAITAKVAYAFFKGRLKPSISYGHYFLPDVKDYELNKYGMPSYNQVNVEVRYSFPKYLQGLSLQLLMVYKGALGDTYNEYKYSFNKVNMFNWNFVVDYNF